ncbi:MAG TPA: hypothetical protein VFL27_14585 [Candidatus Dormibacteraeota bacterium]|nr:hypothetical protein [Candidatus Dormibacteraeota bacterium]
MNLATTETLDGSYRIMPKPERVRMFRLIFGAGGASVILIGALFVVISIVSSTTPAVLRYIGLLAVVMGVAEAVIVPKLLIPAGIIGDAMSVRYAATIGSHSVPRADLALIFRGLTWVRGRYGGGSWEPSYVFGRQDGTVAFSALGMWFSEDRVSDFAQGLGVPMRGDFSVQVRDRVEPSR